MRARENIGPQVDLPRATLPYSDAPDRISSARSTNATFDEATEADRAGRVFDRGFDLAGMLRQSVAVLASGDRTAQLKELRVPTLVLHGTADRLFDISGGRATAAAIDGAELVTFEGMGHSLPRELWPTFADHIGELVHRAEATRT